MATPVFVQRDVPPRPPVDCRLTLVVSLPSRWKEFPSNLRAALRPAGPRLVIEQSMGRLHPDWIAVSATAHVVFMAALIWLVPMLPINVPVVVDDRPSDYKVVYYPTPSLPQVEDSNTYLPGKPAASTAEEAFHPTQTIRISRGSTLRNTVVDVPQPFLRRMPGLTANLLSLPAAPLPVLQAQPAPVEIRNTKSRLATSARTSATTVRPELSRVSDKTLPQLAAINSSVTMAPADPPSIPKAHVDTEVQQTADLRAQPLTPVPQPVADPAPSGNSASNMPPAIVISINSGDAVGIPANGGPGSLAMSPAGRKQPPGSEPGLAKTASRAPANGSGNGGAAPANGTGGAATAGNGSGTPGNGTLPGFGSSTSAGTPPTTLSPGVTVRGGVVSLDSFGPRVSPASPPARKAGDPTRKPAPVVVVATGRSGGGLSKYGVFKSQQVYTVYVETTSGSAVLEFALHDPGISASDLTAPDAIEARLPPARTRAGLIISCLLDTSGKLQNVRLVKGAAPNSVAILDAIRGWRFHPALMGGSPVVVDALIGIGAGR